MCVQTGDHVQKSWASNVKVFGKADQTVGCHLRFCGEREMSAFRRRWSELLKEGWSKRPRGLDTEYTYCRPGKTRGDVRGVDYFVGSEELMRYLDELDKGILQRLELNVLSSDQYCVYATDLERHEAEKTTEQPSNSQTRDGSD
ncbi:Hypothetical protein PHPALM_19950, partial [Phytophthora palmivora]